MDGETVGQEIVGAGIPSSAAEPLTQSWQNEILGTFKDFMGSLNNIQSETATHLNNHWRDICSILEDKLKETSK